MLHFFLAAVAATATASPSPAPSAIGQFFGSIFSSIGQFFGLIFGWIPVVIANLISLITQVTHNPGISLIIVAALITLAFWPLNVAQFKSMLAMQKVAPKIKALQARYKSDPQKLQQAQMEMYRSEGVNPLAGCLPTLVQLPVLFSVYYAVIRHRDVYAQSPFLWIGSALAAHSPVLFGVNVFAASLAQADLLLILIYMVSQYLSMRFTTMPATDPAQAQQLKIMQTISPLMIGYFGLRANWPAAMVLYWLFYNVFRMGQQFYLLKKYHEPLSFIDSEHVITEDVPSPPAQPAAQRPSGNGSPKRKKKKGAKS